MRIQSSHCHAQRGLDPYFSPPEATAALLAIELGRLPQRLWEPAAGDGAIAQPLCAAGFDVVATDIVDYLTAPLPHGVTGIITNPPYRRAVEFARKALGEVPYLALLLRTNFLESTSRLPFFRKHPVRVWVQLAPPANDAPARMGGADCAEQYLLRVVRLGSERGGQGSHRLVRLASPSRSRRLSRVRAHTPVPRPGLILTARLHYYHLKHTIIGSARVK
jgi:hypothetical protein